MPDGRVKYLRTKSYGIRDRDGRLEHVGAIQDATEHRLSEEALAKVSSELAHVTRVSSLGVLTASIAHEINQPLSASSPTPALVCGCWLPILQMSTARAKLRAVRFAMAIVRLM